jgi:hypothetical protein
MEIKDENFLKAHREGCSDVKRVLETLAPDLFEVKFPAFAKGNPSGAIYLFVSANKHIRLTNPTIVGTSANGEIGEIRSEMTYASQYKIKGIKEVE